MSEAMVRKCNKCGLRFLKIEGCNQMTCRCGNKQCFVCSKNVADYNHYDGIGRCPMYCDTDELLKEDVDKARGEVIQRLRQTRPDLKEEELPKLQMTPPPEQKVKTAVPPPTGRQRPANRNPAPTFAPQWRNAPFPPTWPQWPSYGDYPWHHPTQVPYPSYYSETQPAYPQTPPPYPPTYPPTGLQDPHHSGYSRELPRQISQEGRNPPSRSRYMQRPPIYPEYPINHRSEPYNYHPRLPPFQQQPQQFGPNQYSYFDGPEWDPETLEDPPFMAHFARKGPKIGSTSA